MITKIIITGVFALALLHPTQQATAVEALSTQEPAEHCVHYFDDKDGKDAIFGIRHSRGLIDEQQPARDAVFSTLRAEYSRKSDTTDEPGR
ncbi:hypothetical protein FKG94_21925 [Exilibacterium tricleocarpae]|uniref:Uncharacterized protein n=1 Tax=Exilibacterium tricleocarpae TaxID=2591008 RepID=A0A545SYY3_9GAMM|nr:hypothetical protein [Exilibacterium tricleocarpae]TQV70182.1 hypothetical protein FKG94_21925 [Exilibacterium tricleocarpae]